MTESEDHEARERLAVVETGLKDHLIACQQKAEDNTREHGEMKTLIIKASDDMGRDVRRIFARIWLLVGAALAGSGGVILAMYQNMSSGS